MANTTMKFWKKKICVLNQNGDQKKAFANLLLSKKRIPVKFQIDSGSTCSIFTVNVYKDISGDNNLKDLKHCIQACSGSV